MASYNSVTHAGLFGGAGNFAGKVIITFDAATAGSWPFRASPDFGRGGAAFLDGVAHDVAIYNIRDSSNSDAANSLDFSMNQPAKGNHTLTICGFEDCCDGVQQAQFKFANGQFTSFSNVDGHNPVPVPGTLALAGVAPAVMGAARRRRRHA